MPPPEEQPLKYPGGDPGDRPGEGASTAPNVPTVSRLLVVPAVLGSALARRIKAVMLPGTTARVLVARGLLPGFLVAVLVGLERWRFWGPRVPG